MSPAALCTRRPVSGPVGVLAGRARAAGPTHGLGQLAPGPCATPTAKVRTADPAWPLRQSDPVPSVLGNEPMHRNQAGQERRGALSSTAEHLGQINEPFAFKQAVQRGSAA